MSEKDKKQLFIKEEILKSDGFKQLYESVEEDNKEEFLKELNSLSLEWQTIYDIFYSNFSNPESVSKLEEEWKKSYSKKLKIDT